MEMLRVQFLVMACLALVIALLAPSINGQIPSAASPAPPPSNDGVALDQGIAYVLMLLALALTYIMH